MKNSIKILLIILIDDFEFDYLKIKNSIFRLFGNEKINLQVEDFERVDFEQDEEDILIEISTLTYDDESNIYYSVSIEISNNIINKELEIEINQEGEISFEKFENAFRELLVLAKTGLENKIIS